MGIIVIGHTGYCATTSTSNTESDIIMTSTSDVTPSDCSVDIVSSSYTITNNYCEPYIFVGFERFSRISELKEIREGWLKPNNKLRPFKYNSKMNYNLPRSRLREKKQIFIAA